jgi:hypothetical protein
MQTLPQFLSDVGTFIQSCGGLSAWAIAAGSITLLIGAFKCSYFSPLWEKLGNFKTYAPLILALIAGIIQLKADNNFSGASVFAWLTVGAGAAILHDLLDGVKSIPGLSGVYKTIITLTQAALLKKSPDITEKKDE